MKNILTKLAPVRKAAVAGVGAVASIVSLNVLPAREQAIGVAIISLATAIGVYKVPNKA